MTMQMQKATGRGIQSVEVGYRVLNAVQAGPGALTLKEIASRAKLTASAAHNYLVSLGRIGLVQSDRRGAYRLGPSATALGLVALKQADLFESVRAEAMSLYEQTGVGVVIMIWSDLGPVIVFKKEGIHRGAFDLRNGHVSMLTTGGGNIFVTYLDDKVIQPVAVSELKAKGRHGSEWKAVVAEIRADVHAKGFAARHVARIRRLVRADLGHERDSALHPDPDRSERRSRLRPEGAPCAASLARRAARFATPRRRREILVR
jgi:DNA-binding IclR family transcriptional regulator